MIDGVLSIIAGLLALVSITAAVASLIRWDDWWVRMFDFPRLQITFIILAAMGFFLVQIRSLELWQGILLGLLLISLIYQLSKIFPYTFFSKKEVMDYRGSKDDQTLSLMISNVLTTNRQTDKVLQLVREIKPDILLTLESDSRWEKELEVLEEEYQYTVKVPLDNFYGMHLYSRLELRDMEVKFLIEKNIPSIHGDVIMDSGDQVEIHCLHPMPPSPTEDETSTNRDAELLLVGKNIDPEKEPVLVFGDLNDVAWSRTTNLFQKLSGLLDPRIGRGFFNTYHADHFLLRWPLDHVFHSEDFTVKSIRRLRSIGSDHFPMHIVLHLEPRAKQEQEGPELDEEDKENANEKIEKADPKVENID
jgi:endonuclease/exonuclease/phosphatase (EEP) superfamily protein YafD